MKIPDYYDSQEYRDGRSAGYQDYLADPSKGDEKLDYQSTPHWAHGYAQGMDDAYWDQNTSDS